MITTYTFGKKNNSIKKNLFPSSKPNYSKILDDIILADIIDKNSYLFGTKKTEDDYLSDIILNAKTTKDTELEKATNFLANYKKSKKTYNFPFKLNTKYTLTDGTPIIFYDDEIQIGFDYYTYADFADMSFIKALTPKKKKIIIDIYTTAGIDININLK